MSFAQIIPAVVLDDPRVGDSAERIGEGLVALRHPQLHRLDAFGAEHHFARTGSHRAGFIADLYGAAFLALAHGYADPFGKRLDGPGGVAADRNVELPGCGAYRFRRRQYAQEWFGSGGGTFGIAIGFR